MGRAPPPGSRRSIGKAGRAAGKTARRRYAMRAARSAFTTETLYPMSGRGFILLDRASYKALGVYNDFGNSPRATQILDQSGLSAASRAAGLNAWQVGQGIIPPS